MWNELTFLWNELTILWNDLTTDWNDLTWNDLTMGRNDRIPPLLLGSDGPISSPKVVGLGIGTFTTEYIHIMYLKRSYL